ncbi:hypothetical protein C0J52_16615 [Blattella germanica]|nr:hypothetical protein C0J52_16615 [Blattella germanica]
MMKLLREHSPDEGDHQLGLPVLQAYSATNVYFREPSGLIMYRTFWRWTPPLYLEPGRWAREGQGQCQEQPQRQRHHREARPQTAHAHFATVTSLGNNENLDLAGILYLRETNIKKN